MFVTRKMTPTRPDYVTKCVLFFYFPELFLFLRIESEIFFKSSDPRYQCCLVDMTFSRRYTKTKHLDVKAELTNFYDLVDVLSCFGNYIVSNTEMSTKLNKMLQNIQTLDNYFAAMSPGFYILKL